MRLGSAGSVALLAGCTEDVGEELPPNTEWPVSEVKPSLPVRERTEVLEGRIEALAAEEIADVEAFAAAIEDQSIEIVDVTEVRDVLAIGYVTSDRYDGGILGDLGPVAGAYAALVESGYEAVALMITLLDDAPEAYGSAEVNTRWASGYNDGELSATEYGELVATTIESHRHEPEIEVQPAE